MKARDAGPSDRYIDLLKQGFMKQGRGGPKSKKVWQHWLPNEEGLAYEGASEANAKMSQMRHGGVVKQVSKAQDVAFIPEADGALRIKPTDGARQAFKGWATYRGKAKDAVTPEEIAEAGRAMVAAQRSGDRAKIQAAQNAYRALRDQAGREENEHYVAVKKAQRNTGAEKEHQSMLRAMKHGPGAKAKDGLLSSPLLALAALLAIFSHFNKETVGPGSYDLRTYQPKRKEW